MMSLRLSILLVSIPTKGIASNAPIPRGLCAIPLTGGVILIFTDLVLPRNGGHDLGFTRTYNSKANGNGLAGPLAGPGNIWSLMPVILDW